MNVQNMAKGMNHMSNAEPDETMATLDAAMEKVHQLQQQLAAAREAVIYADAEFNALHDDIRQIVAERDAIRAHLSELRMMRPVVLHLPDALLGKIDATLQRDRQP